MRILFLHNYYQIPGGEDFVLKNEVALLRRHKNIVVCLFAHNKNISSLWRRILIALLVPFSFLQFRKLEKAILKEQPHVIHIHNYFPIFTPSVFYACRKHNIPIVHTLHNYRAICPTALLMYESKIEEKSIKKSSWWTIKKRVYRDSFLGTLSLAIMVELHKNIGTWNTTVDRFIALTEFARFKYVEAGWPAARIVVKPNFIEDPFIGIKSFNKQGGYAIFVGRLSQEKGVPLLFKAWKNQHFPLKVLGEGPLEELAQNNLNESIEYLGSKNKKDVLDYVQNADFIILPSTWYEGFPMVLVEAFACGTPALVSRLGSMEEIVEDNVTGRHFEADNVKDLSDKIQWMIGHPEKVQNMGKNARKEFLNKYTSEKNYQMLMEIYQQAIDEASNV